MLDKDNPISHLFTSANLPGSTAQLPSCLGIRIRLNMSAGALVSNLDATANLHVPGPKEISWKESTAFRDGQPLPFRYEETCPVLATCISEIQMLVQCELDAPR